MKNYKLSSSYIKIENAFLPFILKDEKVKKSFPDVQDFGHYQPKSYHTKYEEVFEKLKLKNKTIEKIKSIAEVNNLFRKNKISKRIKNVKIEIDGKDYIYNIGRNIKSSYMQKMTIRNKPKRQPIKIF